MARLHEHLEPDTSSTTAPRRRADPVAGPAVQRFADDDLAGAALHPNLAREIADERGRGQPLDDRTRGRMEGSLGQDLSSVRVHTDDRSDQLSRSVNAEAFTTGADVFFRAGRYSPETSSGRELLGHELTHVVQQSAGEVQHDGRISSPSDRHEQEASAVGAELAGPDGATAGSAAAVQRHELDPADDAAPVQRMEADEELDEEEGAG